MIFIEQGNISGQIIRKKGLVGNIAIIRRYQADTVDDAASIGINDKNWLVSRIQYDRIGCLLPDAVDGEKLLAKLVDATGKQAIEVITTAFSQPLSQGFELERLGVIVTTGADNGGNFGQAVLTQRPG